MASSNITIELENYDRELITRLCDLIEGLEAKPEQMQSVVRQQDAALSSDESGGSAAGYPDGDKWIGEFEAWLIKDIEHWKKTAEDGRIAPHEAHQAVLWVQRKYYEFKGRGAA